MAREGEEVARHKPGRGERRELLRVGLETDEVDPFLEFGFETSNGVLEVASLGSGAAGRGERHRQVLGDLVIVRVAGDELVHQDAHVDPHQVDVLTRILRRLDRLEFLLDALDVLRRPLAALGDQVGEVLGEWLALAGGLEMRLETLVYAAEKELNSFGVVALGKAVVQTEAAHKDVVHLLGVQERVLSHRAQDLGLIGGVRYVRDRIQTVLDEVLVNALHEVLEVPSSVERWGQTFDARIVGLDTCSSILGTMAGGNDGRIRVTSFQPCEIRLRLPSDSGYLFVGADSNQKAKLGLVHHERRRVLRWVGRV